MKLVGFSIIFLIALCTVSARISDEKRGKIKKAHEECQTNPATNIDDALVAKIKKGEGNEADIEKFGNHYLCVHVKMGIQKENGDIITDVLRKEMEEDTDDKTKVEEVMTKCGVRKPGDSPGATAHHLTKCIYKTLEETPSI